MGAQWLSGRVLDSLPRGCRFEHHWRHCVVSMSKNINPSLVLVQPRNTRPFLTERLLTGCKESNQTNKQNTYFQLHYESILNLKGTEKSTSENVNCFSHLLLIFDNMIGLCKHRGKQCGPRYRSSLIWIYIICQSGF